MAKKEPRIDQITDPIDFITRVLRYPDGRPVQPHAAQEAIIRAFTDTEEYVDVLVEAGRQLGKSVGLAWLICWYMVRFAYREVFIVAPSLDQARIIYNEVIWQFENTALRVLIKRKPVDFPFPHLTLINGSELHGRGANSPKYLRGHHPHLVIEDESAFFKEGIHSGAIEPMFTVTSNQSYTGTIRISTPFGDGDFAEGVLDAKEEERLAEEEHRAANMRYLHFTSFDNPHANRKRLERIRDRYGEDSLLWRVEYMAESVGNELAVFKNHEIRWAYEAYPHVTEYGSIQYPFAPSQNGRYVQGVDLANRKDYFVATVLDVSDPLMVQVRHDRAQQLGYGAYKGTIRANYSRYNNARTLIDSTTLGESVVEDLQDIRAEGYDFSGVGKKYDLIQGLVRAFNENRIAIPFVPELISELRNFQYEFVEGGTLRMEARRGHDDYVISLALANELGSRDNRTAFFLGGFPNYAISR